MDGSLFRCQSGFCSSVRWPNVSSGWPTTGFLQTACIVCVRVRLGVGRDSDSVCRDFHMRVIMRGRQEAGVEGKEGRNGINQRQYPKNAENKHAD